MKIPDPKHLRSLIVWLEDQKIRHYKVEDRKSLREIESEKWPEAFDQYCKDVGCPITTIMPDKVEWFIAQAIRLEYEDNRKFSKIKLFYVYVCTN